jgi:cell division initiation protein
MKLTALEIKQQNFEKSLRGYDVGEVSAFLNVIANEWEHMVSKNRDLERVIDQFKDKLKHYEKVEEALHETLQAAKESSEQRLSTAKKEAQNRIMKAEMEAEQIVREATQQRHQIRQEIMSLLNRREEIIRGMRSYLELAQESLGSFSRVDAQIFSLGTETATVSAVETKQPFNGSKPVVESQNAPSFTPTDDLDDLIEKLD